MAEQPEQKPCPFCTHPNGLMDTDRASHWIWCAVSNADADFERLRRDCKRAHAIVRQHEEDADRMNRVMAETEGLLRRAGILLAYARGVPAFILCREIAERLAEPIPRTFWTGDRVRVHSDDAEWDGMMATVRFVQDGQVSVAPEGKRRRDSPLAFDPWELELVASAFDQEQALPTRED